jgi:hypothetical protein
MTQEAADDVLDCVFYPQLRNSLLYIFTEALRHILRNLVEMTCNLARSATSYRVPSCTGFSALHWLPCSW